MDFMEFVNKPLFIIGKLEITLLIILLLIPIFVISALIGKIFSRLVKKSLLKHKGHLGDSYRFRIEKLTQYGVATIAAFTGLSIIGIDLSAIAVIFGALGIGIGFGLQNFISNFSAGLIIFFTSPIKEGDRITVGTQEGYVTKINTISTIVTTLMDETMIVPNSLLISDVIFNHTFSGKDVCIENVIIIDYAADVDKAMEIMAEALKRNPYGIENSNPDVRVSSFEEIGIKLVSYMSIKDVKDKGRARAWNNLNVLHAFQDNDIPLPTRRINVMVKS